MDATPIIDPNDLYTYIHGYFLYEGRLVFFVSASGTQFKEGGETLRRVPGACNPGIVALSLVSCQAKRISNSEQSGCMTMRVSVHTLASAMANQPSGNGGGKSVTPAAHTSRDAERRRRALLFRRS